MTLNITGAVTSVITAKEIAQSPEQTLPAILSLEPGVQVSNLFGGVNGARATVDIRGFGATGASNTLILINGRRMDMPDSQAFDWGSIPLNSVERVEITRGSSGGVLYGDGAVGGVINIVTKTGENVRPNARVDGAFGSFNQVQGRASASASSGPHAIALFANSIRSDGYRVNSKYNQTNAVADYRYTRDWGSIYLNVTASDQHLGYAAGRRVDPWNNVNQLIAAVPIRLMTTAISSREPAQPASPTICCPGPNWSSMAACARETSRLPSINHALTLPTTSLFRIVRPFPSAISNRPWSRRL